MSDSPRPFVEDGWTSSHDADDAAGDAAPYSVLAQARWDGVEFLLCQEDIRRPTHWAIDQPRHTVIVHLGGTMRTLETEIEGAGATHDPPAPGDVWLIPSQRRYASQARGNRITYVELRLAADVGVDLPHEQAGHLADMAPRLGHRDEFLYYSVAELGRLVGDESDLAAMMADRLQRLLRQHLYLRYCPQHALPRPETRAPAAGFPPIVARRIGDYIDAHLDRRISLDDLAQVAGVGVHRLLIAFRRNFGTTPAQYVLSERLRRARWLLLNTSDDIAAIAAACGFASHSHLTSSFKRDLGMAPRQFREGLRTRIVP